MRASPRPSAPPAGSAFSAAATVTRRGSKQETAKLADVSDPFGIGFITWSLAKQPALLDIALEARPRAIMLSFGDPKPFAPRIKSSGALLICQVQTEDDGAAGARCRRRHPDRAGHRGRRPWRLAHHHRYRAGDRRSRGRPGAGCGRRRHRRWPRARGDDDAGRFRRAARHALLCQPGMRRPRGSETAHLRCDQRQQRPRHHLRSVAQQCLAGAVHRPLPDQRSCAALDRAARSN